MGSRVLHQLPVSISCRTKRATLMLHAGWDNLRCWVCQSWGAGFQGCSCEASRHSLLQRTAQPCVQGRATR